MEPPMADLQYLVFVGPGVFLAARGVLAIAAYRRHRAASLRPQPASRSSQSGIAYRRSEA